MFEYLSRMSVSTYFTIGIVLLAAQGLLLFALGQPVICACDYIKLWEGVVLSPGNSQHLSDWYTFSHIIHGIIFYAGLAWLFPAMPMRIKLLFALGIEVSWEVIENTPLVIDLYRQQALAQGYMGDSILNSIFDTVAMLAGAILAWRLPAWATIGIAIVLELFLMYMIRDNLTLNILNFIHVFPGIETWQAGS